MAHMSCICGAHMSNVMCPSDNIIHVMKRVRVERALAYNADIKLVDFLMNWDERTGMQKKFISDECDFWYCPQCKRVYQCDTHIGGKRLAVFGLLEEQPQVTREGLTAMEELIVFSNIEEDAAIEDSPTMLLSEFVDLRPSIRYYLSSDNKKVYAFDCESKRIVFAYQVEELTE